MSEDVMLLPCPFCGAEAMMGETEGDDRIVFCYNDKCGVHMADDMRWGEDEYCAEKNVADKWNRRAAPAATK